VLQLERSAIALARPGVVEDLHQSAVPDFQAAERGNLRVGEQVIDTPGRSLDRWKRVERVALAAAGAKPPLVERTPGSHPYASLSRLELGDLDRVPVLELGYSIGGEHQAASGRIALVLVAGVL
jgi:hypothetical protein